MYVSLMAPTHTPRPSCGVDLVTDYGRYDLMAWTERTLTEAVEFARRETDAIARARAYHLARAIERGTCAVGHDLTLPEIPINSLGTHPCGYCTSAQEAMVAS